MQKVIEEFDKDFKYYYMGLYFQDCVKSVYKGNYKPSQVACPVTFNYVYLTPEIRAKIDSSKRPQLFVESLVWQLEKTKITFCPDELI